MMGSPLAGLTWSGIACLCGNRISMARRDWALCGPV